MVTKGAKMAATHTLRVVTITIVKSGLTTIEPTWRTQVDERDAGVSSITERCNSIEPTTTALTNKRMRVS